MFGRKIAMLLMVGLLFVLLCAGCSVRSPEELYSLPKHSDEYYDLQKAIDSVMQQDSVYAGPLSGSNQQAVQLSDLDGDGVDEALLFVRASGVKPLKIFIFDRQDEVYENVGVIEGDGSGFDAVEYAELDGDGGVEIVVGRQLSDQILQSISAYSYHDGSLVELMSATYSEFAITDLDGDDRKDVFLVRTDAEARNGVAELYRFRNGIMAREQEAVLSAGAGQVKRIVSGFAAQGVPAVFVASSYEADTIITDIFAFTGNQFSNVALMGDSGLNAQTVRNYHVYATDIDEDGIIELPMPVVLPSSLAGEETFWVIDWYTLTTNGERNVKLSTYHNYAAGWYVILPQMWRDRLTVSREHTVSGVTGHVFSKWNGYDHAPQEIFTIFAFTGENRLKLAQSENRFLLAEKGDTAYSAKVGDCDWAKRLTNEELSAMFHFIYQDWNTGER